MNVLEENGHCGVYRYAAAISSTQVNMYYFTILLLILNRYDNKNEKASLGFYSHYVIHETEYFKGGVYFFMFSFDIRIVLVDVGYMNKLVILMIVF